MNQQMKKIIDQIKKNWMIYAGVAIILAALLVLAIIQSNNKKQQIIYDSLVSTTVETPEPQNEEVIKEVISEPVEEEPVKDAEEPEEVIEEVVEEIHYIIEDNGQIINFEELQALNSDIYAWIYMPNTQVNYPIFQHETILDFYLNHSIDGSKTTAGSIYTHMGQSKEFEDFATILYGHDMKNGSMFGSLRSYYDGDFFDENEYIYVYEPSRKLTYQIIKTHRHNDNYLPYEFDYFSEEGISDFLNLLNKKASKKIEHDRDVSFGADDKYIILSTCYGSTDDRYLVIGKLIADEKM